MSVPHLKQAIKAGDRESIIKFVRLHLGDGNEKVGKSEIDKSWIEATKILLREEATDEAFIAATLEKDEATLALLYYHLHFYFIKKSEDWIHDGRQ